jgi:hypothetical protein
MPQGLSKRLSELTALRVMPKRVEARCFNDARVALHRIGNPLRLALPDHRGLEVIIADDAWLCVDALQEDIPILAWCHFASTARDGLHEPVACELRLYHMHAGLIMGSAVDSLTEVLDALLADYAKSAAE